MSAIARMIGRAVIPKLFEKGYGARSALRYMRTIRPMYRDEVWLADWREITGAKKLERTYRFIPKKYALSYSLMAPSETYMLKKFKYLFDIHNVHRTTGEVAISTNTFESDRRIIPEEAEQEMTDIIKLKPRIMTPRAGYEFSHVELKVVYRKVK